MQSSVSEWNKTVKRHYIGNWLHRGLMIKVRSQSLAFIDGYRHKRNVNINSDGQGMIQSAPPTPSPLLATGPDTVLRFCGATFNDWLWASAWSVTQIVYQHAEKRKPCWQLVCLLLLQLAARPTIAASLTDRHAESHIKQGGSTPEATHSLMSSPVCSVEIKTKEVSYLANVASCKPWTVAHTDTFVMLNQPPTFTPMG